MGIIGKTSTCDLVWNRFFGKISKTVIGRRKMPIDAVVGKLSPIGWRWFGADRAWQWRHDDVNVTFLAPFWALFGELGHKSGKIFSAFENVKRLEITRRFQIVPVPLSGNERLCQFLCQICGPTGKIWKIGTFSFVTFEPQEIRKLDKMPFVQLDGANTTMAIWAWLWRHDDVIKCPKSKLCTNRKEFMKPVVLCAKILLIWSIEKERSGISVPFTVVPQWDKTQEKVPKWCSTPP